MIPVILATQEAELGRILLVASLGKKFSRPHLNQLLGIACLSSSATWRNTSRISVQADQGTS
jgi:hypothetical protein